MTTDLTALLAHHCEQLERAARQRQCELEAAAAQATADFMRRAELAHARVAPIEGLNDRR